MCLTICIVTKPHLGKVCIFLPILFKGKLIHYICVIPILKLIVLLPHISPWTQIWIQAFIVAFQNLTFKSVKQNCCFRNQRWDAVKSRQALKKVASNWPIRMQYFLPESIKLQSEFVQRSTFFWLVYLQTSRHATQMNWIITKVKCIVHMGLSKVKILRKPVAS